MLRQLLSHQLALQIRFTDNSGKLAFGSTKLSTAVKGTIGLGIQLFKIHKEIQT